MDEPKVILSKFRIPLLIGLVLVLASGAVLYVQQQKKSELDAAIELVKILNLRIGVGSYGNQEGTGLFGNLQQTAKNALKYRYSYIRSRPGKIIRPSKKLS